MNTITVTEYKTGRKIHVMANQIIAFWEESKNGTFLHSIIQCHGGKHILTQETSVQIDQLIREDK